MRAADFFIDVEVDNPFLSWPDIKQELDTKLLDSLRSGPLPDTSDVSVAEGLLDLVQDEFTAYGTDGTNELDDKQIALALRAMEAVTTRLGIPLKLPFRNFTTFRTYWLRNDGYGSWQARRDMVDELLDPCRTKLADIEIRTGPMITEEAITNLRDATAIREHLARLQRSAHNDPPLAIGTAKELVESTAKTVLLETGESVDDKEDLPALVTRSQQALGLHPSSRQQGPDGTDAVKRILGGLITVTTGLAELRNRGYGTGHGPKGERVGLHPRHAHLAVNAAMTWCSLMLDTLADPAAPWHRRADQS